MTARRVEAGPGSLASDRGSGTIWLVGVMLAVLMLAGVVAGFGGAVVARHRAATAADLGALAGARYAVDGAEIACDRARQIITENGGELDECRIVGLDLIVTARVRGPVGVARSSARAGPIRTPE